MRSLRKTVYELLEAPGGETGSWRRHDWVDLFLMTLITLNIVAVILETVPEIGGEWAGFFWWFEFGSVVVFSVEYLLRLLVCTENPRYTGSVTGRLRFALSPMAIVDLLAILPFYLPMLLAVDLRMLRMLRMLRFLRVLKLGRYSTSMQLIGRVLHAKRADLLITMTVVIFLLTLASGAMYVVEHEAQPQSFDSIPKAMWWGIATLTTVGYGDVYPITAAGKLLAAVIALLGVGIFALPAGILASGFSQEIERRGTGRCTCPACGHEFDAPRE